MIGEYNNIIVKELAPLLLGYPASLLQQVGYPASLLQQVGYPASLLQQVEYPASLLQKVEIRVSVFFARKCILNMYNYIMSNFEP